MRAQSIAAVVVCASLAFAACTVKKTEQPPLSGPSEFALSLSMSGDARRDQSGRRVTVVDQDRCQRA